MHRKPIAELAQPLLAAIEQWQTQNDCLPNGHHAKTCYVALDGYSGSGKSTLAKYLANTLSSLTVIEGDEFYTGGSVQYWSARSVDDNALSCINWKAQYAVISNLKSRGFATWHAFDWHSDRIQTRFRFVA